MDILVAVLLIVALFALLGTGVWIGLALAGVSLPDLLRAEGAATYTGPLTRLTLRCLTAGSSRVEMRSPGPEVIGTKLESPPASNVTHQLRLTAVDITCS